MWSLIKDLVADMFFWWKESKPVANLAPDPKKHGNGTEKSSFQLCLDLALKNGVRFGLDSHLSAPGRGSGEEMSFCPWVQSLGEEQAVPTARHKHLYVSLCTLV